MSRGRALGPGRLTKQGRNWVLVWTDEHGKRRRKALSTDRKTAERVRLELVRARDMNLAGLGAEHGQSLPLREIADAYLEDLEARVTEPHFRYVRQRLERTFPELGVERVRDLKPMHVIRLRNKAVQQGKSHRTANLVVSTLQAALRWAAENDMIASSPIEHVKKLPETKEHQRYKRRAMSEGEIERFLARSEHDDDQCELIWDYERVPQTPFWFALLETGARYKELRLASWGDLDLAQRLLLLRAENTKSRKQRVIPLRDELVERLRQLKVLHESVLGRLPTANDPIFRSPEGLPWSMPTTNAMRIFNRLLERAGIPKVDAQGFKLDIHALRHTSNSRLAKRGVPTEIRRRLLGHSDSKLTDQVYTHLDAEDLRDAVEALDRPQPIEKREAR